MITADCGDAYDVADKKVVVVALMVERTVIAEAARLRHLNIRQQKCITRCEGCKGNERGGK